MRYAKLDADLTTRYDETGSGEYGCIVVGDDHVVRWFSRNELANLHAVGDDPNDVNVYEDGYGSQSGAGGVMSELGRTEPVSTHYLRWVARRRERELQALLDATWEH